jgi:hypothetical protein
VSRPPRLALAAVLLVAFAAASFGGARVLTSAGGRAAAIGILRAQARGDRAEVLRRLDGCRSSACRAEALRSVARLRRRGRFQVLTASSSLHPGLGAAAGTVRVAWRVDEALPTVQCVAVRRTGSVLAGFRVRVDRLPPPIGREASC